MKFNSWALTESNKFLILIIYFFKLIFNFIVNFYLNLYLYLIDLGMQKKIRFVLTFIF